MFTYMKTSTKILIASAFIAALAFSGHETYAQTTTYNLPENDSAQDFHIDKDGNVRIRQAKVFQITGTTFYIRYYVGMTFIRVMVKTEASTKVYRRFGDEIKLSQIAVGDLLNIDGKVENGSDNLSVMASKLINFSNQKAISGFSGTITAMGSTTKSFILNAGNQGVITLAIGDSTQIKKGNRTIPADLVRVGDKVTSTVGTFDHATKILDSNVIVIYTDMKVYVKRNFQGTLKTIAAGDRPEMTVNIDGKNYSVIMNANAEVMNKQRAAVSTKRFVVGDTIRIYGNIREVEEPIIDAEIIRNLSL